MAGYSVTPDGYAAIGEDINNENIKEHLDLTLQQVMDSTFLAEADASDDDMDEVPDETLFMTPQVIIKSSDKITVCEMQHDEDTKHFEFDKENCDKEYLLPTLHADHDIVVKLKYYSRQRWEAQSPQKAQDEVNQLLRSSKLMKWLEDNPTGSGKARPDGFLLVIGNGDERKMHLFLNENGTEKLISASAPASKSKRKRASEKSIGMPAGTHTYRPFRWKKANGDIMGHMGYTIMHCSY